MSTWLRVEVQAVAGVAGKLSGHSSQVAALGRDLESAFVTASSSGPDNCASTMVDLGEALAVSGHQLGNRLDGLAEGLRAVCAAFEQVDAEVSEIYRETVGSTIVGIVLDEVVGGHRSAGSGRG